jgi:hypothetical protein
MALRQRLCKTDFVLFGFLLSRCLQAFFAACAYLSKRMAVMQAQSRPARFEARMMSDATPYKNIIVERKEGEKVLLVTLNRPKALNALNASLMGELIDACEKADANPQVSCIVLTGMRGPFPPSSLLVVAASEPQSS